MKIVRNNLIIWLSYCWSFQFWTKTILSISVANKINESSFLLLQKTSQIDLIHFTYQLYCASSSVAMINYSSCSNLNDFFYQIHAHKKHSFLWSSILHDIESPIRTLQLTRSEKLSSTKKAFTFYEICPGAENTFVCVRHKHYIKDISKFTFLINSAINPWISILKMHLKFFVKS